MDVERLQHRDKIHELVNQVESVIKGLDTLIPCSDPKENHDIVCCVQSLGSVKNTLITWIKDEKY